MAVLTLGLGIGANTAVFSIVHAVLLRPLPYPDSSRLVKITFTKPGLGLRDLWYSAPELDDVKDSGIFQDLSPVHSATNNMGGSGRPVRVEILVAGWSYFPMLGATPQIGRLFGPQDQVPGFAESVVISDALWRREFGADVEVVGRKLLLNGDPYTIVGVLPPGFRHPEPAGASNIEVFSAAGFSGPPFPKPSRNMRVIGKAALGRLKPGIGLEQAQARLNNLSSELRREYPNEYPARAGWSIEIQSLQKSLVGSIQPMLAVLMGTTILIVLIASVNVANLLLARASVRRHEIAVRLAIGAGSGRIVRQMLTESVILSLIAGALGVGIAAAAWSFILHFVPVTVPRVNEVDLSWTVFLFALLVSAITGVAFGLAPAIQAVKPDLFGEIRDGSRGSGFNSRNSRLRSVLIVSELALSVVLIVGAGLLLRTLWTLLHQDPGFNPSRVVTARFALPIRNDPQADPYLDGKARNTFIREVLRRMRTIPGVETAGITNHLPMVSTPQKIQVAPVVEGRPAESTQGQVAVALFVCPEYFNVMQVGLLRGRFFEETDETGKPPVAIIDEATAHRYWPGEDPMGRRLKPTPAIPWLTVVGIIHDVKHDGLDQDGVPHLYVPLYQFSRPGEDMSVVLRTSLPAATLEPAIQRAIQRVDPQQPIYNVRAMDALISDSLSGRRFAAELLGVFAALALLLCSVGIYGLLDYMVGQRSREIAIRMALGGRPADVRKLVFRHGMLLAGTGILAGLVVAAVGARLISALLYGVSPFDPQIWVAVPVLLLAVAWLAIDGPARRATRVDPMAALREG